MGFPLERLLLNVYWNSTVHNKLNRLCHQNHPMNSYIVNVFEKFHQRIQNYSDAQISLVVMPREKSGWPEPGSPSLFWLSPVAQLGKDWLVKFKIAKTKLVVHHHHRADPELPPIIMNTCSRKGSPCLEHLLRLKLSSDPRWNSYTGSIPKDAGKMIASLYRFSKYLAPLAIIYLYKSRIRIKNELLLPYMGWSCPFLDRVQKSPTWSCRRWIIFHATTRFPQPKLFQNSHCFIATSIACVLTSCITYSRQRDP